MTALPRLRDGVYVDGPHSTIAGKDDALGESVTVPRLPIGSRAKYC